MNDEIPLSHDTVWVSYHQLILRGLEDPPPDHPDSFPNGLVAAAETDGATILTGISMGPVEVTAELVNEAPPPAVDEWEEVVELSVESTHGSLHVFGLDGDLTDLSNLAWLGPGRYRLRVHARGRDTDPDGTARTPFESYLIISWPADHSPEVVYKRTDRYGQMRRSL
ncbi:hypothetical protein [Nonomuraea sp. NPDC050310]|uniref:hypothetical protein n=1 Tax=Nonomuraea sp. NPDC050310 TaxID=3154935 RepID=UPI0033D1FFF4